MVRVNDNRTQPGSIAGRVEICIDGHYGTLCDHSWDNEEASVVCTQLGLSPYGMILCCIELLDSLAQRLCLLTGAIADTSETFSDDSTPTLLNDLSCNGTEVSVGQCNNNTVVGISCGQYEDAGIVCQGKS